MEEVRFIQTGSGGISYQKFGIGPKTIIALHGFGQSAYYFKRLGQLIGQQYTIYAIDLPFHGKSKWEASEFSKTEIRQIVEILLHENQLKKFSFLGHSFGARIICTLLNTFSNDLEYVFLLAPDGFGTRWLWLPENTPKLARNWLQNQLQKPDWLINLSKRLSVLGLIDSYIPNYLKYNLENDQRRARLFHSWNTLAVFVVNEMELRKNIKQAVYKMHIILGEQDPIISEKRIRKKLGKSTKVTIHLISRNHTLDTKEISIILLNPDPQSKG